MKNQKMCGILISLFLGLLAVGCGGRSATQEDQSERRVQGTVTYQRLPIKVDSEGHPIGLESPSNAEALPLRGALVRAIYLDEETMPDESKVSLWKMQGFDYTNNEGKYSIILPEDETLPVFVEIQSAFNSGSSIVRIIADPDGMKNSAVPQADRVLYSLRKGLDGSAPDEDNPDKDNWNMPAAAVEGNDIEVDFEIGLEDKWLITHPSPASLLRHANKAELEPIGTGSKIAAIIDTAYTAVSYFGDAAPGGALDLHYRQGWSEPLGTYVEYDRGKHPLSFDPGGSTGGGTLRYFGSVRGGGPSQKADDAWDEGTLLAMMARNSIRSRGIPTRFQFPPKRGASIDDPINLLTTANLHPTMALAEGLPEAMAAITLGTPYLTSGSGTAVRDIRKISDLPEDIFPSGELPRDIFSGPTIAAFAWDLALKANAIDSPGDPSLWVGIFPSSISRIYYFENVTLYDEETYAITEIIDLPSMFTQLTRLYNLQSLDEPIDLAGIFDEETIKELTQPFFGDIWPRPEEGELSCFITDWGNDPDSKKEQIPNFTFSMSGSTLDADENYSNITKNENFTAKFKISKDTAYRLSVVAEPQLPEGASIEVRLNGNALSSYIFDSAATNPEKPESKRIVLIGYSDSPISYLLDFSIKSPKALIKGDVNVQVRLEQSY